MTCTIAVTTRRTIRARSMSVAASLLCCAAPTIRAQSAQPYSLQAAALVTRIGTGSTTVTGMGIEPQLRFNRVYSSEDAGVVSIGLGGQYSLHSGQGQRLQMAGLFVEPRWALPFNAGCAYPYLSARASVLRVMAGDGAALRETSTGHALGAGPGVTFRMTRSANLDVGVQYLRQRLGATRTQAFGSTNVFAARLGVTLGLPR